MQSSVLGLRNPYTQLKTKQLHEANETVKKQNKNLQIGKTAILLLGHK